MKNVDKAEFNWFKTTIKSMAKHDRPRFWGENAKLVREQGFKFTAAQTRSIENLVY